MKINTKTLTLMAMLLVICIVSRQVLSGIGSVQPVSVIIFIFGLVYGSSYGILLGAMCGLMTNLFLGFGTWVIFQMIGWGLIGFIGGLMLRKDLINRLIVLFSLGFVYGAITNLDWFLFYTQGKSLQAYLAICVMGLPYDMIHAINNVIWFLLMSKFMIKWITNYKENNII